MKFLILISIFFLGCKKVPDADNGSPKDVLSSYLKFCVAKDHKSAKECWTDDSFPRFRGKFESYCELNGEANFKYGNAVFGKTNDVVYIYCKGMIKNKKHDEIFYFKRENNKWFLHKP